MSVPITALYAGLSALLLIILSARISRLRMRAQVGIGDGGNQDLARAIRVQGNFIEYAPLALLLILLAEAGGMPSWAIHTLGAGLVIGRLLHAIGLSGSVGVSAPRFIGTTLTWLVLLAGGILAIYSAFA